MNRMLIVGNGFDLEHGLKTTYWDFREYLEENHLDFLIAFEKMYNFYPIDFGDPYVGKDAQRKREETVYNMLWEKFEELMGNPDIGSMINASECILDDLNLDGGNIGIEDTMDDYWENEYGFIQQFPDYVKEWIEQISTDNVKDIVETVFIYNAYCDGKGLLMGNPVGGGKDKVEDKKFDENSARFWEKVLEIEEKLNLNFIPPKDDIEFETICMVEQLYQNLICKKPIKKRDIATSITSDMNMREGINLDDLIGKQIFFQYNATTTFELFEMQFSLPSIVGIFNSIFESYEILDNKTKVILGTKDKGQKPFTAILCFASDSDMNEYVKENPDCYENILSKAKFPQDYLE